MNKTVLRLVQDVLSAMNSDEVNSIGDTVESEQVTRICREEFDILSELKDWGHRQQIISLTASTDTSQPTRMLIPSNVSRIEWIRYDKRLTVDGNPDYQDIYYRDPKEWIELTQGRGVDSTVLQVEDDIHALKYKVRNNVSPQYWTSFDDTYIWFDAYNADIENTLQSSKVMAMATVRPTFVEQDTHVVDIPDKDFYLYKSIVLARAYAEIKETPHPTAASTARQLLIRSQINKGQRQDGNPDGVNYGR